REGRLVPLGFAGLLCYFASLPLGYFASLLLGDLWGSDIGAVCHDCLRVACLLVSMHPDVSLITASAKSIMKRQGCERDHCRGGGRRRAGTPGRASARIVTDDVPRPSLADPTADRNGGGHGIPGLRPRPAHLPRRALLRGAPHRRPRDPSRGTRIRYRGHRSGLRGVG